MNVNDKKRDEYISDKLRQGLNVCQECLTPFLGATACPSCGSEEILIPESRKRIRQALKLVVLMCVIGLVMASCESPSQRNYKLTQTIPMVHPDQLPNHILMNIGQIWDDKVMVDVYNYKDTTFQKFYIPSIYGRTMNPGDTIRPR